MVDRELAGGNISNLTWEPLEFLQEELESVAALVCCHRDQISDGDGWMDGWKPETFTPLLLD